MPESTLNARTPRTVPYTGALFAYGFRPFFLAAGLFATVAMPLWMLSYLGYWDLDADWHAHEMVFGFAGAALAGFLLTAIPNWTGQDRVEGVPLLAFVIAWLAGRVTVALGVVPDVDLVLLTTLGIYAAVAVVTTRNARNYIVPVLVLLLSAFNAVYHYADPTLGLQGAIWLFVAMITLIGGRITPAFTQNALRAAGDSDVACTTPRFLQKASLPIIGTVGVSQLLAPHSPVSGVIAGAGGIALLVGMLGWHTTRTWRMPIVLILHVGYIWIPVGLFLICLSNLTDWPGPSAALHALTAGAIGTMVLAVASRAALGHLGRPLRAAPATVVAYGLVIVGTALRVVATTTELMVASGVLWSLGFAVFIGVYAPMLLAPRVDGKPG